MAMTNRGKGIIGASAAAVVALAVGFTQPWEGRSLQAYQDIVHVWTICDGDTQNVRPGQVATPAECDQRLYRQLQAHKAGLDVCLTTPLPADTAVALLDWTYNVGVGAACGSTLVKLANTGNLVAACDQLLRWNRAGGRVIDGLTRRREAERVLCRKGLGLD